MNYINGSNSKEIYTPNYDLVIEGVLEAMKMPYFSGFIGDINPFFSGDVVENIDNESVLDEIAQEVLLLCSQFPVPEHFIVPNKNNNKNIK